MLPKPKVNYKKVLGVVSPGLSAMLFPIDHPSPLVSNQSLVQTSPVVSFNAETGRIETENTIYLPVQELEDPELTVVELKTLSMQ